MAVATPQYLDVLRTVVEVGGLLVFVGFMGRLIWGAVRRQSYLHHVDDRIKRAQQEELAVVQASRERERQDFALSLQSMARDLEQSEKESAERAHALGLREREATIVAAGHSFALRWIGGRLSECRAELGDGLLAIAMLGVRYLPGEHGPQAPYPDPKERDLRVEHLATVLDIVTALTRLDVAARFSAALPPMLLEEHQRDRHASLSVLFQRVGDRAASDRLPPELAVTEGIAAAAAWRLQRREDERLPERVTERTRDPGAAR